MMRGDSDPTDVLDNSVRGRFAAGKGTESGGETTERERVGLASAEITRSRQLRLLYPQKKTAIY